MSEPWRILVVDDETHLADGIRENLEAEGYETDVAYDGEQGYEKLKRSHFDLALVDVMMPKMDGLELCAQLRRDGARTECRPRPRSGPGRLPGAPPPRGPGRPGHTQGRRRTARRRSQISRCPWECSSVRIQYRALT
jgi:hypothetical protein